MRWTIHRPTRGWYLRLRSPVFPPGAAISLVPLAGAQNGRVRGEGGESKLTFGCQTLAPPRAWTSVGQEHSYPPSRTSTSSQASTSLRSIAASPRAPDTSPAGIEVETEVEGTDLGEVNKAREPLGTNLGRGGHTPKVAGPPPPQPRWQVTHYVLQTGIPEDGVLAGIHHHQHLAHSPSHTPHTSFLSRALAPLVNLSHGSSHHFTIQPLGPSPNPAQQHTPPGNMNTAGAAGAAGASGAVGAVGAGNSHPSVALVAFTDSTPVLRATPSGTLSVDVGTIRNLGVDLVFWVTVSLAFLDFLRDRDVSVRAGWKAEGG